MAFQSPTGRGAIPSPERTGRASRVGPVWGTSKAGQPNEEENERGRHGRQGVWDRPSKASRA